MLNEILYHTKHGAVLCKSHTGTVATVLLLNQDTLKPIPTGKLNISGSPRYEVRVTKKTNLSSAAPYTKNDRALKKLLQEKFPNTYSFGDTLEQFYIPFAGKFVQQVKVVLEVDWKERIIKVTPYKGNTFVFLATFLYENFEAFSTAIDSVIQESANP